jgi:hypothetical protein
VDEPEEISSDEVEEADPADAVEAADDPVEAADDEVEAVDDEVEAVDDEVEALEDGDGAEVKTPREANEAAAAAEAEAKDSPLPEPLASALDPWFAQLAHGYCPPEGAQFARHTPPTNFPGRDQDPTDPSRLTPPPTHTEGAPRGKRS